MELMEALEIFKNVLVYGTFSLLISLLAFLLSLNVRDARLAKRTVRNTNLIVPYRVRQTY